MADRATVSIGVNPETDEIELVPGVITGIQQGEYEAPFGMYSDSILIYNIQSNEDEPQTVWGTLQNFFEEWNNFKETWNDFITNGKFFQYGNTTPLSNNVKLLFEINNEQIENANTPSENSGEGE